MEIPILRDVVVILGLSILIILAFQRVKVPAILGFMLAGIIAGPYGFNLISASSEVDLLSEIGIIFLLFVIGIEFSLKELIAIKGTVLFSGSMQVWGTILLTALITYLFGLPLNTAVFVGFLFSLSSTAIVLKLLHERGEVSTPNGRLSVAILIFQDIIVVPMMLFTPLLTGQVDNLWLEIGQLSLKVVGVIILIYLLSRYIVPVILKWVVNTKNRELFILTITVFCFATAWLTSSVGLSLALGAFFAGLIISESDYSHQATANVLPFREIFISFFFISVGTLLNVGFFLDHILVIISLALLATLIKILVISLTVMLLHYPPRIVLLTAFSLFQVGEFSLLLSSVGVENGLLDESTYQYFLSISILSMGITPFVINYSPRIINSLLLMPIPAQVRQRFLLRKRKQADAVPIANMRDHLVVVGYGINGKNIAKAAKTAGIRYVIIDLDPQFFNQALSNDEPVVFGDASEESILHHVHVQDARVVVIAISDPESTKRIVSQVRSFTKDACIIVRTRYVREIEANLRLGADEVVPEEFETSIEIFTRVLRKYMIAENEIHRLIQSIRKLNYSLLTTIKGVKPMEGESSNENP